MRGIVVGGLVAITCLVVGALNGCITTVPTSTHDLSDSVTILGKHLGAPILLNEAVSTLGGPIGDWRIVGSYSGQVSTQATGGIAGGGFDAAGTPQSWHSTPGGTSIFIDAPLKAHDAIGGRTDRCIAGLEYVVTEIADSEEIIAEGTVYEAVRAEGP